MLDEAKNNYICSCCSHRRCGGAGVLLCRCLHRRDARADSADGGMSVLQSIQQRACARFAPSEILFNPEGAAVSRGCPMDLSGSACACSLELIWQETVSNLQAEDT